MPIQTFTMITATSAYSGELSHGIGPSISPMPCRKPFRMPVSWSRIDFQVALATISGISHGSRNSARSTPLSGKLLWKNSASSMPMTNWKAIEATVKIAVLASALRKIGSATTRA